MNTNNRSKLIEKISKYENRVKFYGLFEHLGWEISALRGKTDDSALIKNCLSNHVTKYAEIETFLSFHCNNLYKNSNKKRMNSFEGVRIFMLLHSWLKFWKSDFRFEKFSTLLYHNKVSLLAIFRRQATLKMKKNMINQMKKWILKDHRRQLTQ